MDWHEEERPSLTASDNHVVSLAGSGLCYQSAQTATCYARARHHSLSNGSKEMGLFVSAISLLYIRLRYGKPSVLVKNLFAVYRGHPNPSR